MKVTVKIFFSFKEEVDGDNILIDLPAGAKVSDAFVNLSRRFPTLSKRLFTPSGEIHRHLSALVNGTNVTFRQGFNTGLKDGDTLTILPPVGGG